MSSIDITWEDLRNDLKKYIFSRVENRHDAEDILQEVLLRIYTKINNIKDTEKMNAWIYRVAKNIITDYYRDKNKIQMLQFDDFSEISIDNSENSLFDKLSVCLKPMIDILPEKYKQAILLTELGKLKQKELAVETGLSVSGAKSRTQRGRAMLKEMFLECCEFEFDTHGNIIDYNHRKVNCQYCKKN